MEIQSKVSSSGLNLSSHGSIFHCPISHRIKGMTEWSRSSLSYRKRANHHPGVPSRTIIRSEYNREEEIKAFDDTKSGVKGLVDSGILKVPKIFIRPPNEVYNSHDPTPSHFQIPIIDLQGIEDNEQLHGEVTDAIKCASQEWGFFQVVNHGVPLGVLEDMTKAVLEFHEQDDGVKQKFYTRDRKRRVRFNSNFDLYRSVAASWRDSVTFDMLLPDPIDPNELPVVCRDITLDYTNHVISLGDTLFKLLSEALGLKPEYLKQMNYAESCVIICHYYPPCPEPELTLGGATHTDPAFLTILLQNDIGGLQVLHQDHWVDVNPIPGALLVNIGDFLQIISNDGLKSVQHRILASRTGPRVSVASFLTTRFNTLTTPIGPIKELISDGNRPVYKDILMKDYIDRFASQGLDGKSGLDYFKL